MQGQRLQRAQAGICLLFARQTGDKGMRHVGLSLGDGFVVDARSHQRGILRAAFFSYPWTHCAFLGQSNAGEDPFLQRGDRGSRVKALQEALIKAGFPLPRYGADGLFGRETEAALLAFQRAGGCKPSGRLDGQSRQALALAVERPSL